MADGVNFDFEGGSRPANGLGKEQREQPGNSGTGSTDTGTTGRTNSIPPAAKRRRGRQPLPRDASGKIINDGRYKVGTRTDTGAETNTGGERGTATPTKGLDKLGGFKPNDRLSVYQQIHGIHFAVSILTKQPIFALSEEEAKNLTKALCDVLDYHEINITDVSGPAGLYVALVVCAYSIYKPRLDAIRQTGMRNVTPKTTGTRPATEAEAAQGPSPMMDFTADLDPPPAEITIIN